MQRIESYKDIAKKAAKASAKVRSEKSKKKRKQYVAWQIEYSLRAFGANPKPIN